MRLRSNAACLAILATALGTGVPPRAAAGEDAARQVLRAAAAALGTVPHDGALYTRGVLEMAGQRGTFTGWLDFSNGHSIQHFRLGPLSGDQGYDGAAWSASNGLTTVNDLPATQMQNVTSVYLALDAWSAPTTDATVTDAGTGTQDGKSFRLVRVVPAGGVPATLWFDPSTHLLVRTDVQGDAGVTTDLYSAYHTVGGLRIPYRDVTRSPDGTTTTAITKAAAIRALPAGALARTPSVERGSIAGGAPAAPVAFRFSLGSTGNVVVPVSLGGRPPVEMVFDTGGRNVVTADAARTLKLRGAGGLNIGGVGSSTERASIADVGTVGVGSATLADQQALVLPLPYSLEAMFADVPVDGLIGYEMLASFQTTFDYAKQTVTFAPFTAPLPPPPGATTAPLLSDGSTPYVEASIDGVKGLFMLDTGNSGQLVIFKGFADAHGLFHGAKMLPYVSAGGVGGALPFQSLRAQSFTLGGTTLHAPIVDLTDQKTGALASQTIAGNIGAEVLRRFTVQLDYRNRTIALAANAHANDPFEADRTGLSLSRNRDGFSVLGVVPGSPAAAAGIAAGDSIVGANGTPLAKLDAATMYALMHDPTVKTLTLNVVRHGAKAPQPITITPQTLL